MNNIEFPISLIPQKFKMKVKFKRYKKGDYIYEKGSDKIIYIKEGKAIKLRCDEDGEKLFPHIFSDDEFVGVNAFFTGESDWEVKVSSNELIAYEIPLYIFKEYILSTPLFTQEYIPKCTKFLSRGLRGFYIYSQGGAVAYYAYLLNYFCSDSDTFHFDSYTQLTKSLYVNKSSLYKITKQFVDEGIIEKNQHSIKIIDRVGLINYFDSYKY